MKKILIPLAALAIVFAAPAARAEGPVGIAFVQAEEGTFWCLDDEIEDGVECAAKKCYATTARENCHVTRWCQPAGTSALMTAWLPEFHTTHVMCGMPGEEAALAALEASCRASKDYSRCDPVIVIAPDGAEKRIENVEWPGGMIGEPDPEAKAE